MTAKKNSRTRQGLFGPAWMGVTVIALFAGMLFWSKLRVSSVVPRSAYADPEATQESEGNHESDEAERRDD
ncbi:MAG: hypothetical protein AAGI53_12480 [Planctomycetota bacterium]